MKEEQGKFRIIAVRVSEEKLKELGKVSELKGQTIAGYVRQLIYENLLAA